MKLRIPEHDPPTKCFWGPLSHDVMPLVRLARFALRGNSCGTSDRYLFNAVFHFWNRPMAACGEPPSDRRLTAHVRAGVLLSYFPRTGTVLGHETLPLQRGDLPLRRRGHAMAFSAVSVGDGGGPQPKSRLLCANILSWPPEGSQVVQRPVFLRFR